MACDEDHEQKCLGLGRRTQLLHCEVEMQAREEFFGWCAYEAW